MSSLVPASLAQYWQQRNARERMALVACGGVVLLAILYSLLIDPVAKERARLERSLPNLRADAARFARDVNLAKGVSATGGSADIATLATSAGLDAKAAQVSSSDAKHSKLTGQALPWANVTHLLSDARAQGWTLAHLSAHSNDGITVDVDAEWTK